MNMDCVASFAFSQASMVSSASSLVGYSRTRVCTPFFAVTTSTCQKFRSAAIISTPMRSKVQHFLPGRPHRIPKAPHHFEDFRTIFFAACRSALWYARRARRFPPSVLLMPLYRMPQSYRQFTNKASLQVKDSFVQRFLRPLHPLDFDGGDGVLDLAVGQREVLVYRQAGNDPVLETLIKRPRPLVVLEIVRQYRQSQLRW